MFRETAEVLNVAMVQKMKPYYRGSHLYLTRILCQQSPFARYGSCCRQLLFVSDDITLLNSLVIAAQTRHDAPCPKFHEKILSAMMGTARSILPQMQLRRLYGAIDVCIYLRIIFVCVSFIGLKIDEGIFESHSATSLVRYC